MKDLLSKLGINVDILRDEENGGIQRYFLRLHPETTMERIEKKALEIALASKSYGKPIIYPITHQGIVVLELIKNPQTVVKFGAFSLEKYTDMKVPIVLGRSQFKGDLVLDLKDAPHMLVAGTTGSGKSVLLNSIICSVLESKRNTKLALIDPKMVEFTSFKDVSQLLYPVVCSPPDAKDVLEDLVDEMNARFKQMAKDRVSNISEYPRNEIPYIVVVVDEFSDLILSSKKDFGDLFCLLAQKSRACGIHLVIATQRPSVRIVNGVLKANFPTRVSFKVSSTTDSRVILDESGAENLNGKGDGLINSDLYHMHRFQGAFLPREEIALYAKKHEVSTGHKLLRRIKGWLE